MSNGFETIPRKHAHIALLREQMAEFGDQITWLSDPSLIPESAVYAYPDRNLYASLASWMVHDLVSWSAATQHKLNYRDVFEKYELPGPHRVDVREKVGEEALNAYNPGLMAMAEIHEATPSVATREGIEGPEQWSEVASDARRFGVELARKGTLTQALLRNYFSSETAPGAYKDLDPAKLVIVEGGLTSTTPVHDLLEIAREANDRARGPENNSDRSCPALYTTIKGLGGITMFNAIWDAYGACVDTYITPHIEVSKDAVPAAEFPSLDQVREEIEELAIDYAERSRERDAMILRYNLGSIEDLPSMLAGILDRQSTSRLY